MAGDEEQHLVAMWQSRDELFGAPAISGSAKTVLHLCCDGLSCCCRQLGNCSLSIEAVACSIVYKYVS